MLEINDDTFTLMENDEVDYFAVRINEGDFRGVIYRFGKVDVEEKDGQAFIHFEFEPLVTNPIYTLEQLDNNPQLEEIAGQILQYMLSVGFYGDHPEYDEKQETE
jgi:hypothetical protein